MAAAQPFHIVVNDAPNRVQVFCAVGDAMMGVANGSFAIPAGQAAIFIRVTPALGGPDWRAALLT